MPRLEQVNLEDLTELFRAVHQHDVTVGVRDRTHELHIDDALGITVASSYWDVQHDSDEAVLTVKTGAEPIWGMEPERDSYDIVRAAPKFLPSGLLLPLVRRREWMPFDGTYVAPGLGYITYLTYSTIGQTLHEGGELAVLPARKVPTLRATGLLGAMRVARSGHGSGQQR